MSVKTDSMAWSAGRKRLAAAVLTAVAIVMALMAVRPTYAFAEGEVVAYSIDDDGWRTNYLSVDAAISAGTRSPNPTIYMAADWDLGSAVSIPAGKKMTIDMQGHIIKFDIEKYGGTRLQPNIVVNKGAELTLMSSITKEITYKGYKPNGSAWDVEDVTVTTGGLVTNGPTDRVWLDAPLEVNKTATLNLEGVTIGGNSSERAGGVWMGEGTTLNMSDGASIEHNKGKNAGAVFTGGKNATVNMDHASLSENVGEAYGGGGIYVYKSGTHIKLNGGSKISDNQTTAGGGVCLHGEGFELTSDDGTGAVSGNVATSSDRGISKDNQSGGGIHVDEKSGDNGGLIENITISGNYSAYDGGGIELDQENTTLRNCIIKDNWCKYEGGGIYVCNDGNVIDGCTITGNSCNVNDEDKKNYEGGGVFVSYSYDIELKGMCIIKGNSRGKDSGNADDVFLRENVGATAKAYVTGSLDEGSSVGVRTGIEKADRRIAKNFNYPASKNCLFMDLDDYFVTYGTDEGGDAWQRYGTKEFSLTVNGEGTNRYKCGEPVTVNGASADASKVFKCWNASESTGLYPFADYISDVTDPTLSFKMPQNDVNLVAEYVMRATAVTLTVDTPVPNQSFAYTGKLSWTDANGKTHSKDGVAISWMKVENGVYTPVSGPADYNGRYVVSAAIDQDLDGDLAFMLDMDEQDVTVNFAGKSSTTAGRPQQASVDAAGTLNLLSGTVSAPSRKALGAKYTVLTVMEGTSAENVVALLPRTAVVTTDDGQTVTLDTKPSEADLTALIGDGGTVKMPEYKKASVYVPLKGTSTVNVPVGVSLEVQVTVTIRREIEVAVPTVDKDEGTYEEVFSVTPNCTTQGATIMYSLTHSDEEGSTSLDKVNEKYEGTSGIALSANQGGMRIYRLKLWATVEKSGTTYESERRTYTYVIDDTKPAPEPVQKVKVKVVGTDTGWDPASVTLAEYEVDSGSDLSIVAPSRGKGYAFEKWKAADGVKGSTISLSNVTENTTVTAVYNPVVLGLDVYLSLPEDDKELAETATKVKAKIADSKDYTDVSDYFEKKGDEAKITWSPSDKKAAHATAYTATLDVASVSDSVKYILSPAASVLVNGMDVHGGAYVVERDGKISVCVRCPVTGPAEYESVDELETVKLSYKQAYDAARSQAAGDGLSGWGLPSTARVNYECGESEDYEITWNDIIAFDESATGAQELTATGAISFADRSSYVSHQGDTETVTVKVRVAAKETDDPDKKDDEDDSGKDDSGKDDSGKKDDGSDKKEDGKSDTDGDDTDENGSGRDGGNADNGSGSGVASDISTTAVTTATASNSAVGKELARTGDYALVTVAAVAAGILATRRKK